MDAFTDEIQPGQPGQPDKAAHSLLPASRTSGGPDSFDDIERSIHAERRIRGCPAFRRVGNHGKGAGSLNSFPRRVQGNPVITARQARKPDAAVRRDVSPRHAETAMVEHLIRKPRKMLPDPKFRHGTVDEKHGGGLRPDQAGGLHRIILRHFFEKPDIAHQKAQRRAVRIRTDAQRFCGRTVDFMPGEVDHLQLPPRRGRPGDNSSLVTEHHEGVPIACFRLRLNHFHLEDEIIRIGRNSFRQRKLRIGPEIGSRPELHVEADSPLRSAGDGHSAGGILLPAFRIPELRRRDGADTDPGKQRDKPYLSFHSEPPPHYGAMH